MYYIAGIVIGFLKTEYTVSEADGTVELQVGVLSGSLSSDVVVQLDTLDSSAIGMYVHMCEHNEVVILNTSCMVSGYYFCILQLHRTTLQLPTDN